MEGMGVECIGDVSEEGGSTQALTRSANNSKEAPKKPDQTGGSKDPKAKDAGKAKDTVGPFLFNDSFPPIPAKLVEKIQTGEFVDMAELLRDNIELERRRGQSESGTGNKSPRREVPDVLSWCACFSTYISVVASKHPERVRQLAAYQTLLMREARRCGGNGWKAYDSTFRQQAASNRELDWSQLNSSLYATTFLAQGTGTGTSCSHCTETDHISVDCALAPALKAKAQPQPSVAPTGANLGLPKASGSGGREMPGSSKPRQKLIWQDRTCYSYNEGKCRFPNSCRYRHACARCSVEGHPAVNCPNFPSQWQVRRDLFGRPA